MARTHAACHIEEDGVVALLKHLRVRRLLVNRAIVLKACNATPCKLGL
jgi:hypothetical protein